jgi:pimeloyl-ACP methyl ester carboxylesterase
MTNHSRVRLGLALLTAAAVAVPTAVATAGGASAASASDTTSAREARRVDRVPTPKIHWVDCGPFFRPGAQCATVKLPLDYDAPKGAKTEVALLRIKAVKRTAKLGTLFLNPGGPGGSGVEIANAAPDFLGQDILDRFDIVGIDPRGIGYGDTVRCWPNAGAQEAALAGLFATPIPFTKAEKSAAVASSKAFGRACSTTGKPLSGSMSTAEVARDMDVLRRAVGDKKLTYLGFSYGTYLGQVYANLFPDRVRAIVIDGVLDPIAWRGTQATKNVPQTARLRSGEGAAAAMHEILLRCEKAGPDYCLLARRGDPSAVYNGLLESVKKQPIVLADIGLTIDYGTLVALTLSTLYSPDAGNQADQFLDAVLFLQEQAATPAARQAARAGVYRVWAKARAAKAAAAPSAAKAKAFGRYAFPYDNSPEAFQSVLCTDGLNPADAGRWPAYAKANNAKAPDFGPLWTWASAPCASNTWTVRDEDAYAGRFTHPTANPVLVIGDFWDPATNYLGAVKASQLLPNSRLLSSDSWGHTAYGTSACVTDAVSAYLLRKAVPATGTTCFGDLQPFTVPLEPANPASPADAGARRAPAATPAKASSGRPAPIVPFVPGGLG